MKLSEAIEKNDLEEVKRILEKHISIDDDNTLIQASFKGNKDIIIELIKSGNYDNFLKKQCSNYDIGDYYDYNYGINRIPISKSYKSIYLVTALDYHKEIWKSYEMQYLILSMYPDKYSLLEEKIGINKDVILILKMEEILEK